MMSRCMQMALLVGGLGAGWAQVKPDTLTVFKTGDTARAAAVNANFKVLWDRVISLAAENQALGRKVDSLKNSIPRGGGDTLESRLPIGTIVASLLPPQQFEAYFGTKTWQLADGSRADGPDFFAAFATDRVPDLRGVFLRGLNLLRTGEFSDPAGDSRTAGSIQGDATSMPDSAFRLGEAGSHTHDVNLETTATRNYDVEGAARAHNTVASPSVSGSPKPLLPFNGSHTHVLSGGDAETRPKNVAVYYYIKVK